MRIHVPERWFFFPALASGPIVTVATIIPCVAFKWYIGLLALICYGLLAPYMWEPWIVLIRKKFSGQR